MAHSGQIVPRTSGFWRDALCVGFSGERGVRGVKGRLDIDKTYFGRKTCIREYLTICELCCAHYTRGREKERERESSPNRKAWLDLYYK